MPAATDPQELISGARDLVRHDDARTAAVWPRAAAAMGRQGLEQALARLWEVRLPGMERATMRSQFVCLPHVLGDQELAGRATLAWNCLSEACHHRLYSLAPTAAELHGWLESAWDLAEAVSAVERNPVSG
jgi:hypothetical protein